MTETTVAMAGTDNAMRLVCAWCGFEVRPGTGLVTHGICRDCRSEFERAWEGALAHRLR